MSITNARAKFGLSFTAASTREGTTGSLTIGIGSEDARLTTANKGGLVRILLAPSEVLDWDTLANSAVTSPVWTAGTPQVETATAAGSITVSGNATAIVTSAGMTGSPKTITFAVLSGDTAVQWAAKARTALEADSVIAARFTVGGSTTAISLTRKPINSFTVEEGVVNFYAANDGTLNIALADATSTGITEAATSTNT